MVAWKLDESGPSRLPNGNESQSKIGKLRRIDFLGSASLASAIVSFLLVLDLGGERLPWTHQLVWIVFAIALSFGSLFVLIEAFVAREPIFPLQLLVHRDVVTAYLVTALQGAAQFGVSHLYNSLISRAIPDANWTLVGVHSADIFPSDSSSLGSQRRRTLRALCFG